MPQSIKILGNTYQLTVLENEYQTLLSAVWGDEDKRPTCACQPTGIELCVVKGARFFLRIMPNTGHLHHHTCHSYAPPLEGMDTSNSNQDTVKIKLAFPLKLSDRAKPGEARKKTSGSHEHQHETGMQELLTLLCDRAGLNIWHPGMAGKRDWGLVRYRILQAAQGILASHNQPLSYSLFLPERYYHQHHQQQMERAKNDLSILCRQEPDGSRLAIVIGQVKQISKTKYGSSVQIKHIPSVHFWVSESITATMNARYAAEIAVLPNDQSRVLCMMTVESKQTGYFVKSTTLLRTNIHWLPVFSECDNMLTEKLVAEQRQFKKLGDSNSASKAVLLDSNYDTRLFVLGDAWCGMPDQEKLSEIKKAHQAGAPVWVWHAASGEGGMPPFPPSIRSNQS